MRVAKLTLCASFLCTLGGPAMGYSGKPAPLSDCSGANEIALSASLDAAGCPVPGSLRADPPCVEVFYTSGSWPLIRWSDESQEREKIKWVITPHADNVHAHLPNPMVLERADDSGHDWQSVKDRHRAGGCEWYYQLAAYGESDDDSCMATLDPGIKFNPGGGGNLSTKLLFAVLGVVAVALILQLWLNRRRPTSSAR